MIEIGKKFFYILWICSIIGLINQYIHNPNIIEPESIRDYVQKYDDEMLLIYIVLTIVRGFFLIPSTPFVIGGGMLFPDKLFLVLVISMIGVMFSATTLYYFADILGFSKYLNAKYSDKISKLKILLQDHKSTYFVIGWSFFPLVPTDLICYVAGIVKMPFKYLFIGVFFGELVLDVIYVYFGSNI